MQSGVGTCCRACDRGSLERLCRYIARPAVSNERLSVNDRGQVVYRLKHPFGDGTTHEAQPIEHVRRKPRDPGRQDLRLPSRGRRREPFELCHHGGERLVSLAPVVGRDPLPLEQEAHELRSRHRLNLAPQPPERVAVDAGEQAPLAPFDGSGIGRELPAEHATLGLQADGRDVDVDRREPEIGGKARRGHRSEAPEPRAQHLGQSRVASGRGPKLLGQRERRVGAPAAERRFNFGQTLRRAPQHGSAAWGAEASGASARDEGVEVGAPARTLTARELARHIGGVRPSPRDRLGGGREAEHHERIVHFIGVSGVRPCLDADPVDRVRIEPSDVGGGGRIESAAHRHRPRPALLERRIVEERIGTGVEDLGRQRGRLGEVAGDDPEIAVPEPPHQGLEPVDVHRLGQRVGNGLLHQRMVGNFARPREVLGARDLVREHRGDQILGLHALDVRRDLRTAPEPRDGQRDVGVPPPAHVEHRGVEQRLGEDVAHRLRREIAGNRVEREAVGFAERAARR